MKNMIQQVLLRLINSYLVSAILAKLGIVMWYLIRDIHCVLFSSAFYPTMCYFTCLGIIGLLNISCDTQCILVFLKNNLGSFYSSLFYHVTDCLMHPILPIEPIAKVFGTVVILVTLVIILTSILVYRLFIKGPNIVQFTMPLHHLNKQLLFEADYLSFVESRLTARPHTMMMSSASQAANQPPYAQRPHPRSATYPVPLGPKRLLSIDVSRCHQFSDERVQWLRMYIPNVRCEADWNHHS